MRGVHIRQDITLHGPRFTAEPDLNYPHPSPLHQGEGERGQTEKIQTLCDEIILPMLNPEDQIKPTHIAR